jgi:hypothetical protein
MKIILLGIAIHTGFSIMVALAARAQSDQPVPTTTHAHLRSRARTTDFVSWRSAGRTCLGANARSTC